MLWRGRSAVVKEGAVVNVVIPSAPVGPSRASRFGREKLGGGTDKTLIWGYIMSRRLSAIVLERPTMIGFGRLCDRVGGPAVIMQACSGPPKSISKPSVHAAEDGWLRLFCDIC